MWCAFVIFVSFSLSDEVHMMLKLAVDGKLNAAKTNLSAIKSTIILYYIAEREEWRRTRQLLEDMNNPKYADRISRIKDFEKRLTELIDAYEKP